MKQNFWTITFLILGGACLGFFGLVYWNLSSTVKQASAMDRQIGERLTAIENFLAPQDQTNK